jgi:heme/copper-type cytochrome/quinol oxidase subunit 3
MCAVAMDQDVVYWTNAALSYYLISTATHFSHVAVVRALMVIALLQEVGPAIYISSSQTVTVKCLSLKKENGT